MKKRIFYIKITLHTISIENIYKKPRLKVKLLLKGIAFYLIYITRIYIIKKVINMSRFFLLLNYSYI